MSNGYDVGTVTVIDANTNAVIKTIQVGTSLSQIVVTPDSKTVYVTHAGGLGTIAAIDTATNTVATDINIGFYPTWLTISPSGTALFVLRGERMVRPRDIRHQHRQQLRHRGAHRHRIHRFRP